MRLFIVSVIFTGIFSFQSDSASIPKDDYPGIRDTSDMGSGPELVENFMKTIVNDIPAILRFMESLRFQSRVERPKEEILMNNDKYAAADLNSAKTGHSQLEPLAYVLSAFDTVLKFPLSHNQELFEFIHAISNPQLLMYLRDMAVGGSVSDMIRLALQSPTMQNILQTAIAAMPVFKELITDIRNKNLQDRPLIDVLTGKMPPTTDFTAITDSKAQYSLDELINVMKEDKHFQDLLAKTLDKHIEVHEGLKLLTGEKLLLSADRDPAQNGKYSVTSLNFTQNNFLAQYGTTFLFLLENFSKIIKVVDEYNTAHPDLVKIVGLVLSLDTSMLQAAPGASVKPQPTHLVRPIGPLVMHAVAHGTSPMLVKAPNTDSKQA